MWGNISNDPARGAIAEVWAVRGWTAPRPPASVGCTCRWPPGRATPRSSAAGSTCRSPPARETQRHRPRTRQSRRPQRHSHRPRRSPPSATGQRMVQNARQCKRVSVCAGRTAASGAVVSCGLYRLSLVLVVRHCVQRDRAQNARTRSGVARSREDLTLLDVLA